MKAGDKILCKETFELQLNTNTKAYYGIGKEYKINFIYENYNKSTGHFLLNVYNEEGYCKDFSVNEEYCPFEKYFYSPEETKNIKRTKLIDKMLT